jgi:hypothetical protein
MPGFRLKGAGGVAAVADVGRTNPVTGEAAYGGRPSLSALAASPAFWSAVWIGGSIVFLATIYFAFGGIKGDVVS